MLGFRRATCARGSGQRSVCSGNRDGWSARPSQQGDRAASAACDTPKAGSKNSSGKVRSDGSGQVESYLGRNRLTSDAPYKACSGFTHVTACRIAQSPEATFVTRLRPGRLPLRTARQLPAQPTTRWGKPSSTGKPRRLGALSRTGSHAAMDRLRSEAGKRKATRTGAPQECSRPVGAKGPGMTQRWWPYPVSSGGCPPSWPHSAGCGGTDQGPEGAGHVAQSLGAVSPGSRHDAETLDLLSRNHAETHLWETKGNKLGHSRRSNAFLKPLIGFTTSTTVL